MFHTSIRILSIVLVLAAAASAQLSSKQAEKQLKADVKQTLATWKGAVDTAIGSFDAAAAAFDTVSKIGGYSAEGFYDLFDDLNEASGTVLLATLDSAGNAEDAASFLLDDVAGPGGNLQGILPAGFQTGSGGALDGLRIGMQKELARRYAAVARRLAKSAGALEKGADVCMNFRIGPPCSGHEAAVNQKAVADFPSWPGFGIDIVMAASKQGVSNDGALVVGGSADPAKGKITVTLKTASATPGGAETTYVFEVASTNIVNYRWALYLEDASEGNWVISAQQGGTAAPIVTTSIGVP